MLLVSRAIPSGFFFPMAPSCSCMASCSHHGQCMKASLCQQGDNRVPSTKAMPSTAYRVKHHSSRCVLMQ